MNPEQFTYWLQGFFEIENPTTLTKKQTQQIKNHLELVFCKKTPNLNSHNRGGNGSLKVC